MVKLNLSNTTPVFLAERIGRVLFPTYEDRIYAGLWSMSSAGDATHSDLHVLILNVSLLVDIYHVFTKKFHHEDGRRPAPIVWVFIA